MSFELSGIFAAGLLTFLSPCILPLVPLYLSLLAGVSVGELKAGQSARGRLLKTAVAFTLGLSAVFVGLGLAATSLGHLLVAHRTLLLQLGGLVVFLFGLKFLGVLKVPFLEREARPWMNKVGVSGGVLGAFAFGAAFALGWTPCIGPVLGSVLTFTASSAHSAAEGAAYLGAYAAGLSVPLIAVALVAPWALRMLDRVKPHMRKVELAIGGLLLVMGLLLLTDNLERITPPLSGPLPAAPAAQVARATDAPGTAAVIAEAAGHGGTEEAVACENELGGGTGCGVPELAAATDPVAPALPAAVPEGRALVEFVSKSCPVCQRMAPVVAAAEHDCAGRDVEVRRVDVSEPAGASLARKFGVRGVPTFVFLDKGNEVARLIGEQPLSQLTQSLEILTGARCDAFRELPDAPAPAPRVAPKQDGAGAT